MPTIGLFLSSPSHWSQTGSGSVVENILTIVPMNSPFRSSIRTSPSGLPVLSLNVVHRPAGVGACAQVAPDEASAIMQSRALFMAGPSCRLRRRARLGRDLLFVEQQSVAEQVRGDLVVRDCFARERRIGE